MPTKVGIHGFLRRAAKPWMPTFVGMTGLAFVAMTEAGGVRGSAGPRAGIPAADYAARVSRLTNADSRCRRSSLRALASVVM